MNRAGALIRVSTSKQLEGTSPEKQIELIRELATEQGYELHDRHAWLVAESGAKRERVSFREALTAASAGEVSRIYVYSVDRLGRDLLEMLLFLRDLDDRNVECWEAEKRRQLGWDDFMLQVEGAVAGKERREIIRRTQDGLRRAIKAGKYSGGIIAYGYRLNSETKQLEIDDEEAAIIRMIFGWSVEERLSCVKIAGRLNAMEIPTRYTKDGRKARRPGKRTAEKTAGIWRAGRVRNMLRNPAYMGKWEYGKRSKKRRPEDRIPGYCPAIVSSESFYQAGEVLKQNQLVAPEHTRRQYLLRGLIRCGV
ncbi:MAG: recombinase family protein, partial [Anaerolineales bacterium]